ncbi:MAG: hypothetical protein JW888_02705 [Pirellulales bacterium]|nr:hypothetical protein [Pirellulales bacterium]
MTREGLAWRVPAATGRACRGPASEALDWTLCRNGCWGGFFAAFLRVERSQFGNLDDTLAGDMLETSVNMPT